MILLVYSSAMRNVLGTAGLLGSVSVAFSSMFWSQQKTELKPGSSNTPSSDTNPDSAYELKLVQVLFRHGARTPLKSIPDVMEVKQVSVCSQLVQTCCFLMSVYNSLFCLIKGPVGPNTPGTTTTHTHQLYGDRSAGWTQASSSCRGQLSEEHTERE